MYPNKHFLGENVRKAFCSEIGNRFEDLLQTWRKATYLRDDIGTKGFHGVRYGLPGRREIQEDYLVNSVKVYFGDSPASMSDKSPNPSLHTFRCSKWTLSNPWLLNSILTPSAPHSALMKINSPSLLAPREVVFKTPHLSSGSHSSCQAVRHTSTPSSSFDDFPTHPDAEQLYYVGYIWHVEDLCPVREG